MHILEILSPKIIQKRQKEMKMKERSSRKEPKKTPKRFKEEAQGRHPRKRSKEEA